MSKLLNFSEDHTFAESEKVTFFDSVTIFQDYVPVAETSTKLSVNKIIETCKDRIQNIDRSNRPETILADFEEIRRDAHTQFKGVLEGYWGVKQMEITQYFYDEMDRLFEHLFHETFPLKHSAHKTSIELNSDIINPSSGEEGEDYVDKELTLRLLKVEIKELVLKWFLYVNELANALERCGAHNIKRCSKLEEFYDDLKDAWKKKYVKKTMCQSTTSCNSSIGFLKRVFGFYPNKAKIVSLLDQTNTTQLIADLVYEDIVMAYLNNFKLINDLEVIIKFKGFMMLLTQSIHGAAKNINELIDTSLRFNRDTQEKWGKELNYLLDGLMEFEDRLFYFDVGSVKKYFSIQELRKLSAKENNDEDNLSKMNTANTLKSLRIEF